MSKAKTNRKKVYLFLLTVIVVGAISAAAYDQFLGGPASAQASGPDADAKKADAETIIPVELVEATPGRISSYLSGTANLRALREVDVVSQTEGLIVDVVVEEGMNVHEGQLLCRLDDRQLQIRLQSAQQKIAQAKLQKEKALIQREKAQTQIDNSREDMARYQKLYEEKLVSERDVAQLRYKIDELLHDERASGNQSRELEHRVAELEAEIAEVQLQISQTNIKAPFEGMITQRVVEKGQTVRALDKLFGLSNFAVLHAEVYLSEREARQVRSGQEATIRLGADGGRAKTGTVARISPVVDQATGTVKVTVELKGGDAVFKPGAFVRVDIETDTRDGNILVPKRAIIEEDGHHYVFVAADGVAKRLPVELGYESDGRTEILSGLQTGQMVVVAGQGALKEGSKVKTTKS